jgi:hypothetical protein
LEFGGPANSVAVEVLAMFSPEDERVALTKVISSLSTFLELMTKFCLNLFGRG